MATILSVGVVLLSHACNGSRVFSTNQADNCGAAGETVLCSKLINGSNLGQQLNDDDTDDSVAPYKAGYKTNKNKDGYYGFRATMDVYGLSLSPGQLGTYGLVWIETYGDDGNSILDGIQIGWHVVNPGDKRPVFHLACTGSGPGSSLTGSNVYKDCPGFQPERGASAHPGDIIPNVSQLNGDKQSITLKVLKDSASGDWLLHYGFNRDPEPIGRLPKSIFTSLAYKATDIWFGGMADTNVAFQPTPSLAPMGSGYMAVKNPNLAASMSNIELIDELGGAWPAEEDLHAFSTSKDLYTVTPIAGGQFFYGGPLRPMSSAATSCIHAIYSFLLALFTYYLIY